MLDREFAGDMLLFAIPSDEDAQMVDRGACSNNAFFVLFARGLTSSECFETLILRTHTPPGKTMTTQHRPEMEMNSHLVSFRNFCHM